MFIYCISPYKRLECNFIKIGFCEDISLLKGRYITYYGESCRYYYVKISNKNDEQKIHKKLKDLGLHLENEIFLLNKEYDFYFYVQILKNFDITIFENNPIKNYINNDIHILKRNHFLDFLIHIYKKTNNLKKEIKINYSKKEEIENIWKLYLSFCINIKQYYNTKTILKRYMQSMFYYDNPINYQYYKINFEIEEIIIEKISQNNKYIQCKNKLKILLLYEYIKIRRRKIVNYIKYMINIPLHENIVQNIIKNISYVKNEENIKLKKDKFKFIFNYNETISREMYEKYRNKYKKHDNVQDIFDKNKNINNKMINSKLRKKRYIMEYKILCRIIKFKIIENPKFYESITKIKINKQINYIKIGNDILKFIDYEQNKLYGIKDITSIIFGLMKIINIIKNILLNLLHVIYLFYLTV